MSVDLKQEESIYSRKIMNISQIYFKSGAIVRTKVSNWIYRVFVVVLLIATLRFAHYMYILAMYGDVAEQSDLGVKLIALWGSMNTPLMLAITTLAVLCRSGASVWLIALLFIEVSAPFFLANASTGLDGGVVIVLMFFLVAAFGVASLMFFLIKRGEIRLP
ncbi:hypothetical protein [Pseudovibrio sp. FO-BEG1]|uniref:hypothetical protein n=1 Tax=Pseudovibrio sp. (strain FO-BEG1) TaxID=911045 RepID=UPI0005A25624|nr:hypothetical protein [Pseudovibrio sp. FO-BEG1]